MKVSDQNSPTPLDAFMKQSQQQRQIEDSNRQAAARVGNTDQVHLSDQARQLQQATRSVGSVSDVRQDKIQQIKMEVDNGTYSVVGSKVATDMLSETFENNKALRSFSVKG